VNSINGNYMLPEMVKRYIIKFPDSYVSQFLNDGKLFAQNLTIGVKKPEILAVLQGSMGDDFDVLLQNDNIQEIMKKLNLEGVSIDDPDIELKIIQSAKNTLQAEIAHIMKTESEYKNGGTSEQLKNNEASIREKEIRISNIDRKTRILVAISKLNSDEELTEENEETLNCSICMDGPHDDAVQMSCPQCWAMYHNTCILPWFAKQGVKKSCAKCRCDIKSLNDMCVFQTTKTVNEDGQETDNFEIVAQDKVENVEFESKVQAITEIIGVGDDDYVRRHGLPERSDDEELEINEIRKTLLYLNMGSESNAEKTIIKDLLSNGILIFYDKVSPTASTIDSIYGHGAKENMRFVNNKKSISKIINEFEKTTRKAVFIMRKGGSSVGLDFPWIDAIITYSDFGSGDSRQINGRAERTGRTRNFYFIKLDYVD
jgi:hypothetical protein